MKLFRLLLLSIGIPILSFGQFQIKSFDYAMRRLTHKTWIFKRFVDGTCITIYSNYYFFPTSFDNNGTIEVLNSGTILQKSCLQLVNYKYYINSETKKINFGRQYCNPIICFCDSSDLKNTYNIFSNRGGGIFRKGTFTIISDSEFCYYPGYGHLVRYKSIIPSKEVISVIPR